MVMRGTSLTKRKLVQGVGVNDAPFPTQRLAYTDEYGVLHEKWTHPVYAYWHNCLTRTNDHRYQTKFPAYTKVQIVDEWKLFMGFYSWAETKDYDSGKVLDKDILGNGTLYSPETCCFVHPRVNNFLVGQGIKSKWPTGVHLDKETGKFKAALGMLGKTKNLGRFYNVHEAHLVYCKAKLSYAEEIINEYKVEDYIASALITKLQKKVDEAEILYQRSLI